MRLVVSLLCTAALAACTTVGPNFRAPTPDTGTEVDLPSAQAGDIATGTPAPVQWWTELNDPLLTELIEQGLLANRDIRIANASVLEARTLVDQDRNLRGPTVTGGAALERSRAATPENAPRAPVATPASATVSASWEIDLFGRIERTLEARRANAEAVEALLVDTHRVIAADIATAYIDLREAQQRIAVAQRNLTNQRETERITSAQIEAGSGSELDLVRARARRLTTQASLPTLRAAERTAANRITALLSRAPGSLDGQLLRQVRIPSLPGIIEVGSVSELLRQRPDIRAAERALQRETAEIGVTTADLFPTISLTGEFGKSQSDSGGLSSSNASFFGIGPSLSVAIFDRNEIHARIAQGRARAVADLEAYQNAVVLALEEADTALASFVQERLRLGLLQSSVNANRRAVELSRIQVATGSEPFLSILESEGSLLLTEDAAAISRAALARSIVSVYRACAGGYIPQSSDA